MKNKDILIAIFITFIWGVNFSFIKMGLSTLNPFILAGIRFLLCALPLVFFIKKPDVEFKYIVYYGLSFGVGLWGITYLAMYFGLSAGIASIVLQFGIFFAVILSYFILKEKINIYNKIGFILSLFGVFIVFFISDGTVTIIGVFLVLIASLFLAITNILIKKANTKNVFSFLVYSTLFPPIQLFLLAYLTQGDIIFIDFFKNINSNAIISILFQVYPTTLFGYWVWNSLLNKYPVSIVTPISLLIPIFGLFGSYLFYDEQIGLYKFLACFVIILGLGVNTFGDKIFLLKKIFIKN